MHTPVNNSNEPLAETTTNDANAPVMADEVTEMTTVPVDDRQQLTDPADTATLQPKRKVDAQAAYAAGDVEASRAVHERKLHGSPEHHGGTGSDYVKAIIFGGLDGIVTTFAIVAAAAGAHDDWKTVLVFGFANAIADAWSMGFGEFISGKAELDQALQERQREEWEVEHNIQGERDEMIEIYEQKGFPAEDAKALVDIISKDPKRFVDIMMVEELGILVSADDNWHEPAKQGLVMFISFIFFGVFPLLAYFGGRGRGLDYIFGIACGVTGVGLLILGSVKGLLTGQSVPRTAVSMLFTGAVSGGVSFGVGVLVTYIVTGEASVS
jgi:VIT1/CCC1 family predicted Fe2+/Mn2+ transporter